MKELINNDPLGLIEDLPPEIANIYLEKENPPRLSFSKKMYYNCRPYIPLKIRHILQSNRKVSFEKDWYISEKLINAYKKFLGSDTYNSKIKNIWDGKISPFVLTHDVETEEGLKFIPEVIAAEKEFDFISSWNIVPYGYTVPAGVIEYIRENGCEVGVHDFNHDGKLFLSKKNFDKRKLFINKAISRFNSTGFRGGAAHRNFLWMQELNIEYDASAFDIDPFQPMPGGTHSIFPFMVGNIVELPYTLPQDHVLWIQLNDKTIEIWKKKTEFLLTNYGMILLITHPDYLMMDDNLSLYKKFLKHIRSLNGIWNPLPDQLNKYWRKKHGCSLS